MKPSATKNFAQSPERSDAGLHRRYGRIGIPAVVAALAYTDETVSKKDTQSADAPREESWRQESWRQESRRQDAA